MPYYWQRRQRYRRRRPTFWTWRARKTLRRNRWRKQRRRRHYRRRVRRRRYNKKLKYILVKQFNPEKIRKCKIFGTVCLFQGSPERINHNYIQYIYSYVPDNEPGGGGWCLMIQSLSTLWEDFEHLKNIWTQTNYGLPLVRYGGVTLTFYQSPYTDYIVEVRNCFPMTDTKYKHADSAPNRMLLKKNVIRVPSRETRKKRKPYKRIRIRPPGQMANKWYFQKDICNIPLLMITATSVDFRYPFCSSACKSNNLTLTCLNTNFWQFTDFDEPSATIGYTPKPNTYMYVNGKTHGKPTAKEDLIYLGDTKNYTAGAPGDITVQSKWGNPFWHNYIQEEETTIYISNQPPQQLKNLWESEKDKLTPLTEELFFKVRYNPEKDKGEANTIYLVNNFTRHGWDPPTSENLKMTGFPLYDMCWGAVDWWKKLHDATDIDNHWLFVIRTDQFDRKHPQYVVIDTGYLEGFGAYDQKVNDYDRKHYNPKFRFQEKSVNDICLTGPGCTRAPYNNYVQAKMSYKYHFKWGGCPNVLEKPYDPCSQPNWIIPSNINSRLQIENPNTDPKLILQKWDWEKDYVKQTAIERIQKYTTTDELLPISTDSTRNVPVLKETQTTSESETEEETQTSLQTQINKLKQQQRQLKQRLIQRLTAQALL